MSVKRVYESAASDDGSRVLVDRLWPRGPASAAAGIDEWIPAIVPSTSLRRWFGHGPARFDEFPRRYLANSRTTNTPSRCGRYVRQRNVGR
ncbi:MAG TPA: DUF488 family protein [Micromonosporaceae bacterium]